jgi:ferredoxin
MPMKHGPKGGTGMSGQVYNDLRAFLDQLPTGFPSTPSGVEIKILKKLFTPDEARLVMQLGKSPEKVAILSRRIGIPESELAPKLEALAQKGLIFRKKDNEEKLYQAFQFMIGIYEFQVNTLDKEFCQLFEEYLPHLGLSFSAFQTKQLRVIPVGTAITNPPSVAPYNRVKDLIAAQDQIAVTACICQKERQLLGHTCDKPAETCMAFGDFAQYYQDNQMARPISRKEAMGIIDRAEKKGLVLSPSNTQELAALCCCCTCCCPALRFAKMMPRPADRIRSYYAAIIDPDRCLACGDCIERCPMDAIAESDEASQIIDGQCIGCGLCASTCPEAAITLIAKPGMEPPPENFPDALRRIENERGIST